MRSRWWEQRPGYRRVSLWCKGSVGTSWLRCQEWLLYSYFTTNGEGQDRKFIARSWEGMKDRQREILRLQDNLGPLLWGPLPPFLLPSSTKGPYGGTSPGVAVKSGEWRHANALSLSLQPKIYRTCTKVKQNADNRTVVKFTVRESDRFT